MKFTFSIFSFILLIMVSFSCFSAPMHKLFTEVLADYVDNGAVNYKELCGGLRFNQYIDYISKIDPQTIESEKDRLAFWINAYNAYTLKIICDNYPLNSINELHTGGLVVGRALKQTVWDKELVTINNKKTTLNNIEHKIIRPLYKEPRVHFALVCAAKGCPPLRSEAYDGRKLDKQLNDQGEKFLADKKNNSFDQNKKAAAISKIFAWFKQDFGNNLEEILRFIARFLPADTAQAISKDPNEWKIKYNEYDWSLNE